MESPGTEQRPRVVLAEDDALIRYSLRRILEETCDVVAEAADGRIAVELAEELRPDILLVDISLPVLTGFDTLRLVRLRAPEVRIIVVSSHSDPLYIDEAFRLGASGFVRKGSSVFELPKAIHEALQGRTYRSL